MRATILAVLLTLGVGLWPARVEAETKTSTVQDYITQAQLLWESRPVVDVIHVERDAASLARLIERFFPTGTVRAVGVGSLKKIIVTAPASMLPEIRQLIRMFQLGSC
jgi:hypothetical protein